MGVNDIVLVIKLQIHSMNNVALLVGFSQGRMSTMEEHIYSRPSGFVALSYLCLASIPSPSILSDVILKRSRLTWLR